MKQYQNIFKSSKIMCIQQNKNVLLKKYQATDSESHTLLKSIIQDQTLVSKYNNYMPYKVIAKNNQDQEGSSLSGYDKLKNKIGKKFRNFIKLTTAYNKRPIKQALQDKINESAMQTLTNKINANNQE